MSNQDSSKNTRKSHKKRRTDDDSSDEMPDRKTLKMRKNKLKMMSIIEKIEEIDEDDQVVFVNSIQKSPRPELWPSDPKLESDEPAPTSSARSSGAPTSSENSMTSLMTSICGMMQSQAEMVIKVVGNAPIQPVQPEETTSAKEFLAFVNMYVNSLESQHLKKIQKSIAEKIEKIGAEKISIDKFRLAIEAAVGIIIA